ncbi:MAG TPA: hypothetical protein VMS65_10520, partial [Polyangiaceae bacterium]|nr:hypothetical protein [Polyangiaceae bacterium]
AVVAMGDDRSDEELFRALGPEAYTFAAGPGPTRARFRVDGPSQVRALLWKFVDARPDAERVQGVTTEPFPTEFLKGA